MAKKIKVPKRIAGVKTPKPLRRALKDLARSQSGKIVLTEVLTVAAGLLAAHEARPGSKTRELVADKAPAVKAKGRKLAAKAGEWAPSLSAFEEAARAFTDSLRGRLGGGAADPPAATPPVAH